MIRMEVVENGDNTQRIISNDKLIGDGVKKTMNKREKIFVGVLVFLIISALVGLGLGMYFHYRPSSTHIQTAVSQTNGGTVYSSTQFIYTDNNMVGDSVNQTFTIMFAGVNSSDTRRRMLQAVQGEAINVDTTLHYTHQSGIQIKFRGNQVLNISVPIDKVMEYIDQESESSSRILDADSTQYDGSDLNITGSDIYDLCKNDILSAVQQILSGSENVNIYMQDSDMFELQYDQNSGTYKYVNAAENLNRRRLFSFKHFFHKVGRFVKKVGKDVVHFVKKDGPKILKYGAIAALAGIDIAAKGPSGISDAVRMFKSKNVLLAAELAAEGVATKLPPYLSIPIDFIAKACFSHPPKMHCTKQGAINAAKSEALSYVKKHALTTILSLLQ